MKVKIWDKAPDFSLPDQNGKVHKLKDYNGQIVFVYFYPKDFTPGCTVEACSLRDNYQEFKKLKVKAFGISADSVDRHKKFSEKFKLPFTLLSDEKKKTLKDYGVWQKKKFMGREFMGIIRTSFLIDPSGKIIKIFEKVKPKQHINEVLNDIKTLN